MVAGSFAFWAPSTPAAAAGEITQYMTGLDNPIALAFASDGRIFFAERNTGSIRIIQGGSLLGTPFYTLPNTDSRGERGLLGLALDPGFPLTPYVYAYQTYIDSVNGTIYNRIVRIVANGNTGTSPAVILRLPPLSAAQNHNGGVIAFGPDNKLYAVVGENAIPALSQDPMSPMGKVVRMNTDGTAPSDNPYFTNASWNPLVYTYGHRNMFGLAFHPVTQRPYVTENGPNCNDEINLLPDLTGARRNFGWGPSANCSGTPPPPNDTNQDGPNPVLPIWYWRATICPTNAAIYGGPYFPAFRGDLFMGDCNTRTFHRLHLVPPNYDTVASDSDIWVAPDIILDVEVGLDGAIWITTPTTIYRYWDSNKPPVPSFTASPNPVAVGATVTFDASASYDPDGQITAYSWDFGDSTPAESGNLTTHQYASPGSYDVVLTVTDNESFTNRTSGTVVVQSAPPGPQPPIARFTVTPSPADAGASVTLDASSSVDPDGTIVSYAWDFGDSSPAGAGVVTTHAYLVAGAYAIILTVTDNSSLSSTATHQLDVVRVNRGPRIDSSSPASLALTIDAGSVQRLTVSASDPDGDALAYTWRVNGAVVGGNTTGFNFSSSPGTYIVNVTVSDGMLSTGREWTLTVVASSSPLLSGIWPFAILAILGVATIVVMWVIRRRTRAKPRPPPP
jgi:glucose/arabinose dehydrogenase